MKFNADLLTEMQELSPPVSEKKSKVKKLYLRFSTSGSRITISKDLRTGLFKDCSRIRFGYKKVSDDKNPETKKGKKNYKKQIITVFGVGVDDENSIEIQRKGDEGNDKTFYYLKLKKSQMAELDETLLSTINYVTSRKYIVPESAINTELKCLQIDLENRKKPYFEATKKSNKVIQRIEDKIKKDKEERKNKAEKKAKSAEEKEKNETPKGITTTETGAHQMVTN